SRPPRWYRGEGAAACSLRRGDGVLARDGARELCADGRSAGAIIGAVTSWHASVGLSEADGHGGGHRPTTRNRTPLSPGPLCLRQRGAELGADPLHRECWQTLGQ